MMDILRIGRHERRNSERKITLTEYTWGVYLRPDPITCKAVADLTDLTKRQFGIVSAAAFMPHATLVGAIPSTAEADDWIAALDPALTNRASFPVYNAGVTRAPDLVFFDIDKQENGGKNQDLLNLATDVSEAIRPVTAYQEGEWMTPFNPSTFHAHLSLASHDLKKRVDLRDEVEEYIRAIPVEFPSTFEAEYVSLYRFHSADWNAEWWRDLTWQHIKSWKFTAG